MKLSIWFFFSSYVLPPEVEKKNDGIHFHYLYAHLEQQAYTQHSFYDHNICILKYVNT